MPCAAVGTRRYKETGRLAVSVMRHLDSRQQVARRGACLQEASLFAFACSSKAISPLSRAVGVGGQPGM
jgi:hypothetical protein